MVPISRKRSVTDISMELTMPTVLTKRDITTSQIILARSSAPAAGFESRLVATYDRKAMPSKMPDAVTIERQNLILRPLMAIVTTVENGSRMRLMPALSCDS